MRRVAYLFKIRNIEIELPEPTMKAFERAIEEPFIRVLLGGIKEQMILDFQKLLDSKTYEIISVEDEINE